MSKQKFGRNALLGSPSSHEDVMKNRSDSTEESLVGKVVSAAERAVPKIKDRFRQAVSRKKKKSFGSSQDRAESFIKRLAGVTEED